MIRHYLTFQHEAEQIHQTFSGWTFDSCWSQEKERIYLKMVQGDSIGFVEISLNLRFGYVLPVQEIHRAKKNTIDQFVALSGSILQAAYIHESERAIHFQFENHHELLLFFYGRGSGNIVRIQGGEVVESFSTVGNEYESALSENIDSFLSRDRIIEQILASDKPLRHALSSSMRRLGKHLAAEAIWQTGLWNHKGTIGQSTLEPLLDCVDQLYAKAAESTSYYLYHTSSDLVFGLIRLTYLEETDHVEQVEEFDDLARALRICRSTWFRKQEFSNRFNALKRGLDREEARLSRSLSHAENSIVHIERAEQWEMTGNLLLAHLYQVNKGDKQTVLTDWEGNEIAIKLDEKRTPAENAERYFKKARGARKESQHSAIRAKKLRKKLEYVQGATKRLQSVEGLSDLDLIERDYGDLFVKKGKPKEVQTEDRYRRFVVDGGLVVFAGKNAANNDELTLRFARPNDIWLHARGSSGSHVVLRWNNPKGRPPKRALEEAAMIAAYYSGAKHSNLVPVAWTRKKYVRKPKGGAPGAVIMNREEVVMVPPKLPEGRSNES